VKKSSKPCGTQLGLLRAPEDMQDAQHKEAGVDIPVIGDILKGMPQNEFDAIAWTKKPDWREFCADIDKIVYEMLSGETCAP
jgi:hypothetical protein